MNRKNLEERLIDFAVLTTKIATKLPNSTAGRHYGCQLLRSGSSPALNFGEAQGAESPKDFRHKMSVSLKELRETHICLKVISRCDNFIKGPGQLLDKALSECNELISIFVSSIKTFDARQKKSTLRP